jgi:hypothetical protein
MTWRDWNARTVAAWLLGVALAVGLVTLLSHCSDVGKANEAVRWNRAKAKEAAEKKAAWEGPCREVAYNLDDWDTPPVVECSNKNHRMLVGGNAVHCACPEKGDR